MYPPVMDMRRHAPCGIQYKEHRDTSSKRHVVVTPYASSLSFPGQPFTSLKAIMHFGVNSCQISWFAISNSPRIMRIERIRTDV